MKTSKKFKPIHVASEEQLSNDDSEIIKVGVMIILLMFSMVFLIPLVLLLLVSPSFREKVEEFLSGINKGNKGGSMSSMRMYLLI